MLASAPKECRSHSPLHGRSSCSSRRRCRRGKSLISFFQHEGKAQSSKIWSRSAGGSLGWEHMEPAPPGTPGWAWKCLNHPEVRRGNRAQPVWGARSTLRWLKDKKAAKFPFPERKSIAGVSEIPPGLGRAPEGRNPPFLLGSAPKHHWIPREERNPLNSQQRSGILGSCDSIPQNLDFIANVGINLSLRPFPAQGTCKSLRFREELAQGLPLVMLP